MLYDLFAQTGFIQTHRLPLCSQWQGGNKAITTQSAPAAKSAPFRPPSEKRVIDTRHAHTPATDEHTHKLFTQRQSWCAEHQIKEATPFLRLSHFFTDSAGVFRRLAALVHSRQVQKALMAADR